MRKAENFLKQSEAAAKMWPKIREKTRNDIEKMHKGHSYTTQQIKDYNSWKLDCKTCKIMIVVEEL